MKRNFKTIIAAFLAVLMVVSSMPLTSIAAQTASITISSNVTADNIDIDSDIAFTYEITIAGELYNGSAKGSDGNSYDIMNGRVTVPYNINIIIPNIDSGTEYTVQRLVYDNSKYAYIDASEVVFGVISTADYFVSIDGGEPKRITEAAFNDATDNGTKLAYDAYKDSDGNKYDKYTDISAYEYYDTYEVLELSNVTKARQSDFIYADGTMESYDIKVSDISLETLHESKKVGFITTNYYGYVYSFTVSSSASGAEPVTVHVTEEPSIKLTSLSNAWSKCLSKANYSISAAIHELIGSIAADSGKTAVVSDYLQISSKDNLDDLSTQALIFLPLTKSYFEYSVVQVDTDKNIVFDAEMKPAPTGSFVIDFMVFEGTVPEAYNEATFEIKDALGNTLTEGVDYNHEVKDTGIKVLTTDIGFTKYLFSDIKAGDYTITQKSTKTGFIVDTTSYPFHVDRKTGEVTGENFAKSDFDSSAIALTNNTFHLIKTFKVFRNNSFSVNFTKVDQNKDIVEGAKFVMIERDAFFELLKTLASNGISSIGNININEIIEQITSADWESLDIGTILGVILSIVNLAPDVLNNVTIPAILMATSDENGLVSFDNSSNILNIVDTISSTDISGEELASVLEKYFGSLIPEQYLPYLEALVNLSGKLNINTGIPSGAYMLLETEAPYGYQRNAVIYTIIVNDDGTAVAAAGLITPVIVDKINSAFGVDLGGLIINENQFNQASEAVKNAFGTYNNYVNSVFDTVIEYIDNNFENISTEQLEKIKEGMQADLDRYDDISAALGGSVKDINSILRDEVNEDWYYYDYKCYGKLSVNITDCNGNALNDIDFTVKNSDGEIIDVVNGDESVDVPYGEYSIELNVPSGYIALDGDAVTTVTVESMLTPYSFELQYHIADSEFKEYAAAGCVENGLDAIYCISCGEVLETKETEALGHSFTAYISNGDAACTADGTKTAKCDRCDETDTITDEGSAAGHRFGEWEIVSPSSCTGKGSEKRSCTICGFTETKDMEAAGHSWADDYTVDIAPDCTTQGSKSIHCTVCDAVRDSVTIDALGHDFSGDKEGTLQTDGTNHYFYCGNGCGEFAAEKCSYKLVSSTAPTCTEQGVDRYACTVCGYEYETYTAATGHSFTDYAVTTEATCVDNAVETAVCDHDCGEKDVREKENSALGHSFLIYYSNGDATCTEDGTMTATCTRCSATDTKTDVGSAHHDFDGDIVSNGNGTHSTACTKCDEAIVGDCGPYKENIVPPSCTEMGYTIYTCTLCGYAVKGNYTDAVNHTYTNYVSNNDASCTADGTKTAVCDVCKTETNTITDEGSALGHDYESAVIASTCEQGGYTVTVCKRCHITEISDETEPLGHYFADYVYDNNATCTENGTKTAKCDRCDAIYTVEAEDTAKGHSFGDWETVISPSCTNQGSEKRICAECGYTETRAVDAAGHIWENDYTVDKESDCTTQGSKSIHCTACDAVRDSETIPATGHKGGEANCHQGAICTVCGSEYGEKNPDNHDGKTEIRGAAAATAENFGYTGDLYCAACDTLLETGKQIDKLPAEMTEEKTTEPPAKTEETTVKPAAEHKTEATTQQVNKNKSKTSPDTGANTVLYPLCVSSAALLIVFAAVKKRKDDE